MSFTTSLKNSYFTLQNKLIAYTNSKYAIPVLMIVAFTESSFFIVPPDILIITMALANPHKAFLYAFISTIFTTLGGVFGYFIGYLAYEGFLQNLIIQIGYQHYFDSFRELYHQYSVLTLFVTAFSPFPYKVVTIASGIFEINIWLFIVISFISRGARFFLLAFIIKFFHKKGKDFIVQNFKKIVVITTILVIILVIILLSYGLN